MSQKPEDMCRMPPILRAKHHQAPSLFTPESLLREARRQKALPTVPVPEICILDPDGDILRHRRATGHARREPAWACYHTDLYVLEHENLAFGIVAGAVSAAFAVLVAEELFASGCGLLISMASAGQIHPLQAPPYFIVIERALRDEGTSYHYLPSADYAAGDEALVALARESLAAAGLTIPSGATWTTDAPFRETANSVRTARDAGILVVEMEAAALYAFAEARRRPVLCFAHVTNQMGQGQGDFDKGATDGAEEALKIISIVARHWRENARLQT